MSMFEKSPKASADSLGKTSRIVEGTVIRGNIVSQTDFRMDGELIGNFESNAKIVIGPAGIIVGELICKNADIEGKFEGKIKVAELLTVKSKAVINGEVTTAKLSVEPGAEFTASCTMINTVKNLPAHEAKPTQEKR